MDPHDEPAGLPEQPGPPELPQVHTPENPFEHPIAPSLPPPPPLFHAPSLDTPEFAPAAATPMSIVITEPPRRRHKALFAGIGVLALAGIGVGAFFVFRSGSTDAYSLKIAAQSSHDARVVAMTVKSSASGVDVTMDAQIDKDSGLMKLTMNLGSASPLKGSIEVIADAKQNTVYMSAAPFKDLGLTVDTKWIKIDQRSMNDSPIFDQFNVDDPTAGINYFTQAKSIKDDGVETIAGEQLRHYEVIVAAADVLKADTQLQKRVDQLGGTLPTEFVYEIYVTKDNVVRRISSAVDIGPTKMKSEVTFTKVDSTVTIALPAAKDVTNYLDLLKQG